MYTVSYLELVEMAFCKLKVNWTVAGCRDNLAPLMDIMKLSEVQNLICIVSSSELWNSGYFFFSQHLHKLPVNCCCSSHSPVVESTNGVNVGCSTTHADRILFSCSCLQYTDSEAW